MSHRKHLQRFLSLAMMSKKAGLYIHIPYCVSKCNYCAFLSKPIGMNYQDSDFFRSRKRDRNNEIYDEINAYIDALIKELKIRSKKPLGAEFDTIYFGGGTPSILNVRDYDRILDCIYAYYNISDVSEITIEANPATVNLEKLRDYKSLGINRLSMGVQSFNDEVLRTLGRVHTSKLAIRDYKLARKAGFDNISMDLMFALPGTNLQNVIDDVNTMVKLEPEHISFYSLQLEEGTKFFKDFEDGKFEEVSDELDREMYHLGCEILKNSGYSQYEISNFARIEEGKDYRSRHNSKYWNMSQYVGAGLGASSFVYDLEIKDEELSGYKRTMNFSNIEEYIKSVNDGKEPFEEVVFNTDKDNISEAIFTGLRRAEGIRFKNLGEGTKEWFEKYFSEEMQEIKSFQEDGCLKIDDSGLCITTKGIDISNKIMALFV